VQFTDELLDELPILAGLGDDPPVGMPAPASEPRPDASRQGGVRASQDLRERGGGQ
jgi:hypothetical protein